MSDDPVFVAGLERTGTSLMYALLASHPAISMTRRTNFWLYFADQYGDLSEDANLDACLERLGSYKRIVVLEVDIQRLRAEFVVGPRTYGRLFAVMQEQIATRRGKRRWGDKSLNIERYVDRLMAEYPRARVLHMVRDPRDRLASVLTRWGNRRAGVSAGTARWIWSARLARSNLDRYPAGYRVVHYETLVREPEAELRRICSFIGEDFDATMLTMEGAASFRDAGSNSSYDTRRPGEISATSIRKFEKTLSPRQIALVQTAARQEMADHRYPPAPVHLSTGERLRLQLVDRPYNLAMTMAWRAREEVDRRHGRALPQHRIVEETV